VDNSGRTHYKIEGLWNERLSMVDCSTGDVDHCFKADPRPQNSDRMYGFGYFTINLNYIDDEMRKTLPPTDTRRRPD
jgi:Oxysterol-binding protein